jgi:hypothetical protein
VTAENLGHLKPKNCHSILNVPNIAKRFGLNFTTNSSTVFWAVVEKPAETQASIRLASHLVRVPNSLSGGREFESPALASSRHSVNIEDLWGTFFYIGDPDMILSCWHVAQCLFRWGCKTHITWQITDRLTCPTLRQTIRTVLLYTQMQYQSGTGGHYAKKPAYTQNSIWLASHLVRVPNSLSGGREFESTALTSSRHSVNIEDLWGTVFYIGDPDMILSCLTCSTVSL